MKEILIILLLLIFGACIWYWWKLLYNNIQNNKVSKYQYEWSICIDDDKTGFDPFEIDIKIHQTLQDRYLNRDCKIWKSARKDIVSCLWDLYYSIECKK